MRKLIIIVVSILLVVSLAVVAINVVIIENDMASCTEPAGDVCAKADAIVVVSGGDTFARTDKAVEMYQRGWSNKLIFSGASADPDSISNAEAMRRVATAQGVSDGDHLIADLDLHLDLRSAGAYGHYLACQRFLLGRVGDNQSSGCLLLRGIRENQHAVR